MKTLARSPRATWRCWAPLIALALPACVPALETIEGEAPGDTTEVESQLGMEPADVGGGSPADSPPAEEPGRPGPAPLLPPVDPGESPGGVPAAPPPALPLVAVTPAALIDVPIDAPLRITFAEAIDPASSSTFTLQLTRAGSVPVAGQALLEANGIRFHPAQGLALANSYTLVLEGTVRGVSGAEWTGREEATFETREGTWIAPQLLATSGSRPRIGLDAAGNALAIWNELDSSLSGQARLAMAQYTLAEGWQALPVMATGCGPECAPQFVAGGGNGDFQFAWASQGYLYWQVYHRGAGFEEPESAAARGTNGAVGAVVEGQPWIAMHLPQGITVRHRGPSGNVPAPYLSDSGLRRAGPVLAVDRSQSARVFWAEGNSLLQLGPGADARPTVMDSWSSSETAASITGASVLSGAALLAWGTRYTSTTDGSLLFCSLGVLLVGADGALDGDEPPVPEAGEGNRASPAASLNEDGDGLLGWLRTDGDPADPLAATEVWMAYRSGVSRTWSEAVPLSLERSSIAHPPAVGIDASGNGHGIWSETDPAGATRVFGARLRAGSLSGSRFPISRDGAVSPAATANELSGDDNTRLAVDAAGRALALWVSPTGEIWAARFE